MRRLTVENVLNYADWSMLHVSCFGNIREKNWLGKCFFCTSAQRCNTKQAAAWARKIREENNVQAGAVRLRGGCILGGKTVSGQRDGGCRYDLMMNMIKFPIAEDGVLSRIHC